MASAEEGELMVAELGEVGIADADGAGGRGDEPADEMEQRRLAGA